MFLCLKKVTRPKTSCEKQVVIQLKPNLASVFLSHSSPQAPRAVPKIPGEGEEGCMYCATEGGVMHTVPHTAGLTRKPHYCKLPHFTLSKGATTTKKKKRKRTKKTNSYDFWENFSHGSIKAVNMHLPHTIFHTCFMKCYCKVTVLFF